MSFAVAKNLITKKPVNASEKILRYAQDDSSNDLISASLDIIANCKSMDRAGDESPALRIEHIYAFNIFSMATIFTARQSISMASFSSSTGGKVGAMRRLRSAGSLP